MPILRADTARSARALRYFPSVDPGGDLGAVEAEEPGSTGKWSWLHEKAVLVGCQILTSEFGRFALPEEELDKFRLNFPVSFEMPEAVKKYLLAYIDNKSGCRKGWFYRGLLQNKGWDFWDITWRKLAIFRVSELICGQLNFQRNEVLESCKNSLLRNIICVAQYHSGNGKVERLIRKVNERLITNKEYVLECDTGGSLEV